MRSQVLQERYERIKNEGKREGIREGNLQTAEKMLNKGFAIEDIIECTGLTNEQINSL